MAQSSACCSRSVQGWSLTSSEEALGYAAEQAWRGPSSSQSPVLICGYGWELPVENGYHRVPARIFPLSRDQMRVHVPPIRFPHFLNNILGQCLVYSVSVLNVAGVVVGPVGFEPTTSGPDFLGVTSAPGSPSQYGTLVSFGRGYDPWTKLDDGPTKRRRAQSRLIKVCQS